jgi:isobutyryl-CoA mutase
MLKTLHKHNSQEAAAMLQRVQQAAIQNQNIFTELMEATKLCSLGQITRALFKVGGQYRRNM